MANIVNQNGQIKVGWKSPVLPSTLWSSIFAVYNADGTNNLSVKNAWNANGDAVDSKSGANGTIAAPSGNSWTPTTMTYGSGKVGSGAFTFNGNNFISLPNNTLDFTSDFSVSFWVYLPNTTGYKPLINCFDNSAGATQGRGWRLQSNNGVIGFAAFKPTSAYYYITVPMTTSNQWVHITLTKVVGQEANIYINGVAGTKTSVSVGGMTSADIMQYQGRAYIGADYYFGANPAYTVCPNGVKIDAVQTWDGAALDQTAVTELYNSGNGQEYPFTLSNELISTTNDAVGSNHGTRPSSTLTGGIPGPSFTTGKIGKAFSFDGINDFIQLPNNQFNFVGDFSISAWLYFPTDNQLIGSDSGYILSNWTAVVWPSNLAGWYFTTSGNQIGFTTFNGTSTSVTLGTGSSVPALDRSGWRHIAFTRTGTTYKLWLDGGQYTSTSTTMLAPKYQGTIIPKIGRLGDSTMGGWDSYTSAKIKIDAVSVWNKALSATEITELYNSGNGKQYPN